MASIDPVVKIELLCDLLKIMPKVLDKIQAESGTRFARELLNLFEQFEQLEENLLTFIAILRDFSIETSIGWRVPIVFEGGNIIEEFQGTTLGILQWLSTKKIWWKFIEESGSSDVRNLFTFSITDNRELYDQSFDLSVILNSLRYELQAIRSPDPKLFPDYDRLDEIIKQTEHLLLELRQTKASINEFASVKLRPDDFFRPGDEIQPRLLQREDNDIGISQELSISLDLLDILRCPASTRNNLDGEEKGILKLVKNTWLACQDEGCGFKYPIIYDIPVMLIEEGEKWKHIPVEDLPIPSLYHLSKEQIAG